MNHGIEKAQQLKHKYGLDESAKVGIVGTYCKAQTVDEARNIVSVINTSDIDSQYEVVMANGMDRSYLDRNKKVFLDHQYSFDKAVGSIRYLQGMPDPQNPTAWKASTFVYDKPGDPTGDQLLYVARTTGIGASVGFEALDYSQPTADEIQRFKQAGKPVPDAIIRRWKAIEFSFTAFPCNVACQGYAVEGSDTDQRMQAFDEMIVKGSITREFASRLGFPTTPKRKLHTTGGTHHLLSRTVVILDS
jgi:hypothetical protein